MPTSGYSTADPTHEPPQDVLVRVALTVPSLERGGGVERVSALVANGLAAAGHEVRIAVRAASAAATQPLDPSIGVVELPAPRGPKAVRNLHLPRVVRALRAHLDGFRPDVVIGSRWDCAILSLLASDAFPVVVWDHGYMPLARVSTAWRVLRRLTYRRAAALVLINEASRPYAERLVAPERVHVIRSFSDVGVPPEGSVPDAWSRFPGGEPERKLVAVGRLEHDKGFDLLIDAFGRVAADFPQWGLLIAGAGSEHSRLEAQARTTDRTWLAGPVADPTATLIASDVFAFPSRKEPLGLAFIEAMGLGLCVVAFDCPVGPGEVITSEVDGLLVGSGDVDALASALRRVMADGELRARLGRAATRIRTRFSAEAILPRWLDLLTSVARTH
jgi:glycosyltransferase involved in cell wall biosynthesis